MLHVFRLWHSLLDLLAPPSCLRCGELTGAEAALCPECWGNLRFISDPSCASCGLPFAYDLGPGTLCGACAAEPPSFSRAAAVCVYNEASRPLVTGLKFADRLHTAPALAKLMASRGGKVLEGADMLVPVPLHPRRLLRRRYNQAAELGRPLSRACGVQLETKLLLRARRTQSQTGLTRRQRRENVARAFQVSPACVAKLAGKCVILVDDVMTTGATLEACARTLLRAGAGEVRVLTFARTERAS
ncbi:MAG: ComF family protein [Alphaproteobacteria bacterium]|nr:ComF family protein [Alphaproteobacteria bacterium]